MVFHAVHVYFTVRRVLFQLGGSNNMSALPGDPKFAQKDNHEVALYRRICSEFGVHPSSDFRYTPGSEHFQVGECLEYHRMPSDDAYNQYDWFAPNKAFGLTQVGLSRKNQSIEAFVYCILDVQVIV